MEGARALRRRATAISSEIAETAPNDPKLRPGSNRYRLVIFDFDGTLADTYAWFAATINEVADRYKFRRVEDHEVEMVRAMSAAQAIRFVGLPAWKLPFVSRHLRKLATRNSGNVKLFPGVDTMLAELDEHGVMVASVSSNNEANVRRALGGLGGHFRQFACGAALFRKAKRLRAVMRQCGVEPHETLAVGDELRDLDASRKVGCAFGAVSWGYTRRDALVASGPDHVFDRPSDIVAVATGTP